ncbi:MAG: S41 family peptidase [Lachnospiraceae bacterium]|nr:S41 family peptidase [Lachnospiraceae bacterium]
MKSFCRRCLSVLLVCLMMSLLLACDMAEDENKVTDIKSPSTEPAADIDQDAVSMKVEKIKGVLEKYYMGDIDYDKAMEGIYAGMINSLGDPYTVYFSAEQYQEFSLTTNGNYAGVGSTVTTNSDGNVEFVKPFKNGPAYNAGILPGDILCEIDGENALGEEIDSVVAKIRGEAGTSVNIKIYRPKDSEYYNMTVVRDNVEEPTIEYEMLEGDIGYILCTEFDKVTEKQYLDAVDDLTVKGMKALIIDLRDNPGGMLTTVTSMLDRILPKGKLLIYMEDKNGKREEYFSQSSKTVDVPIAVLINGNSASASEVFAGCLQDYGVATLIGTKSFGKGIVQSLIPLGDGSAIKVTTSKYFSPLGRNIHGVGFEPDIKVELDKELKTMIEIPKDQDNQLQTAVNFLKEKIQ